MSSASISKIIARLEKLELAHAEPCKVLFSFSSDIPKNEHAALEKYYAAMPDAMKVIRAQQAMIHEAIQALEAIPIAPKSVFWKYRKRLVTNLMDGIAR